MKLSTFTDYSLRVLMYLATSPGRRATIAEIGASFDINVNHLTKVAHHLGRCGWLETARGKGGGLMLAKPAEQISIGKVVRDTEGAVEPAECFSPDHSHCAILTTCRLQYVLAESVKAFYGVLDQYTLADITRNRSELANLLHFHRHSPAKPPASVMSECPP